MSLRTKSIALGVVLLAIVASLGATGIRVSGENFIPDGSLKPRSWSTQSGDELPISQQVNPVDIVFNFGTNNTESPPATANWYVWSPRAAGKITSFSARINDNGSSTDIDFILLKNGTEQMASDLTLTHSSTEDTWTAGSLDGSEITFSADDSIEIGILNTAETGAQGIAARIQGYYTGD